VVTGVLGPQSCSHGPNEFLNVDFGKKLTMCLSQIMAEVHTGLKSRTMESL